jgi:alpha-L-fucosidase
MKVGKMNIDKKYIDFQCRKNHLFCLFYIYLKGNLMNKSCVQIPKIVLLIFLCAAFVFDNNQAKGNEETHPLLNQDGPYKATWESLETHKTPEWFRNAKIGFSMHWGPYAVPAWAVRDVGIGAESYSEWYWMQMNRTDSPTRKHHNKIWGKEVKYDQFIPMFKAENFNANDWMKGLKENGVKYFFITSKHHDGFCLWNTQFTNRNSLKMGPKRDILKELVDAARKHDIKIGFYYSLFEWYNPTYVNELKEKTWLGTPEEQRKLVKELGYDGFIKNDNYVDDYMIPQIVELIELFQPDLLYLDGEWDWPETYWKGRQIAAYYYNQAAKRGQEVLLNDRFGKGSRGKYGDLFHVEYHADVDKKLPWAMWRGFGKSFGHNTNEDPTAFLTPKQVVEMVVDCISNNGNIEFNVGPTVDGRIDEPEWSLIQQMGTWLKINGESIYDAESSPIGNLDFGRLTHKPMEKKLFLHVYDWPKDGKIVVKDIKNKIKNAYILANSEKLEINQKDKNITIQGPVQSPGIHVPVIVLEYEGEI